MVGRQQAGREGRRHRRASGGRPLNRKSLPVAVAVDPRPRWARSAARHSRCHRAGGDGGGGLGRRHRARARARARDGAASPEAGRGGADAGGYRWGGWGGGGVRLHQPPAGVAAAAGRPPAGQRAAHDLTRADGRRAAATSRPTAEASRGERGEVARPWRRQTALAGRRVHGCWVLGVAPRISVDHFARTQHEKYMDWSAQL